MSGQPEVGDKGKFSAPIPPKTSQLEFEMLVLLFEVYLSILSINWNAVHTRSSREPRTISPTKSLLNTLS